MTKEELLERIADVEIRDPGQVSESRSYRLNVEKLALFLLELNNKSE